MFKKAFRRSVSRSGATNEGLAKGPPGLIVAPRGSDQDDAMARESTLKGGGKHGKGDTTK